MTVGRLGLCLGWLLLLAACRRGEPVRLVAGGNPQAGKELITSYGCGACHAIPGVSGADGMVGPSLQHFASRTYVAGQVPNTTAFLLQWIQTPQAIEPGTAMPNLGVTDSEARSIAAYLYTLR